MDSGARGSTERAKVCVHCGNNRIVSHFLYWYFESLNIAFAPLRRRLLFNPISRLIKKLASRTGLAWQLVRLGKFLRILSVQPDFIKCKVPRAKVLWEEAKKRGIKMEELLLFGRPFDVYVAVKGNSPAAAIHPSHKATEEKHAMAGRQQSIVKSLVFSGLPRPINYDDSSLDWMDDKWLFKKKMMEHNLPVPRGTVAWNFWQAKKTFDDIQATRLFVIVKPRAGSRGRHSTIFVASRDDLKEAFKIAKKLCHWVIIEEQLHGPVYRATLINFELCGILRGDPPQITGDGEHSVRELIEIKNSEPHPGVHTVKSRDLSSEALAKGGAGAPEGQFNGVKDIIIDEGMERFVQREIFNFQFSIFKEFPNINFQNLNILDWPIPKGMGILLSEKIGVNYGGSSSEDFEICHSDNKELFIRAAKILGDPIVGFDFIIPDIARSWREQKCGFIEANSLPFINLHHDPLLGVPRNVAAAVWNMLNW